MIIETTHSINDIVWMPRVRRHWHDEIKIIDYKEYHRRYSTLEPFVKKKIINSIVITANGIQYFCNDSDSEHRLQSLYPEEELQFSNMESALAFAKNWAETNKTEYFGPKPINI